MSDKGSGPHIHTESASSAADERAISSELLSAVVSLIPDASVVVDEDGVIVSVNQHAEELFGYPLGSLAGSRLKPSCRKEPAAATDNTGQPSMRRPAVVRWEKAWS